LLADLSWSASGNLIAVGANGGDNVPALILVLSPEGKILRQFRIAGFRSAVAWLPDASGILSLPEIRFSLSQLNLNDGSYSLRMPCLRSSSRCSTRFGKVSGIEPRSKQRSWLSGISSSYCNDRTAASDRA